MPSKRIPDLQELAVDVLDRGIKVLGAMLPKASGDSGVPKVTGRGGRRGRGTGGVGDLARPSFPTSPIIEEPLFRLLIRLAYDPQDLKSADLESLRNRLFDDPRLVSALAAEKRWAKKHA